MFFKYIFPGFFFTSAWYDVIGLYHQKVAVIQLDADFLVTTGEHQ